jgi:hypothetical protein
MNERTHLDLFTGLAGFSLANDSFRNFLHQNHTFM